MDEVAYIHVSAVASAMTYATNRGVTILMLCSPADASHWLSQMDEIVDGKGKGVCLITLCFLCSECAQQGHTGICIHGSLCLPWHIDAGGDTNEDPVHQIMEKISPGAYQQEICGFNEHTKASETEVFSHHSILKLTTDNWVDLTETDQRSVDSILVSMDPVQAGSKVSGIGLAIALEIGEVYMVCGFFGSLISFLPIIVLALSLA
jgi:hypothetical protein